VPQNPPPDRPAPAGSPVPTASPASPDPDDRPVLPQQSTDETDVGWGEQPEQDDDERLRQDRPPHWDRD
jgi:hypothetical protein